MRRLMLVATLAMLASACANASAAEPDPRSRKWVQVVVAARDLPAGTVLTFDDIMQRGVPEDEVSKSLVRPESASYIVNQKLLLPLLAGDVVPWSFVSLNSEELHQACAKLQGEAASAEQQVARARQLALSRGR